MVFLIYLSHLNEMKHEIKRVINLNEYLKVVIEPIVRNPKRIRNGRKLKNIALLPREVLGLFLLCAVARHIDINDWTIGSDPEERDGVVICQSGLREGEAFAVEQVYIPNTLEGNLTQLVICSIVSKSSKGSQYGKDRHLIVLCDKKGDLDHQVIKKSVASNNIFNSYWIIGKSDSLKFEYFVFSPKTKTDPIAAYLVLINKDFNDWKVNTLGEI